MEKQTMGAFISALRKSKGITQKELAELLNVSDKAVSRWECDQTTPDIYLLPMIADIFDVTTDELIRGGRIKSEQPTENQEKSIQKRFETILETKFNSYKTKSIISIVLVIVGLIILFVCRYEFAKHELGFGISLVAFVCAIALQTVFLLNFKNSINTSELDNDALKTQKGKVFEFSSWVFTLLFCIEAISLSADWRLFGWCGPVASILVFLLCIFVKSIIIKKAGIEISNKKRHNSTLFIKVFVSYVCVIGVFAASMVAIHVNYDSWIEKPATFYITDSTEEIENYIETGISSFTDEYDPEDIKVSFDGESLDFSEAIEMECFVDGYDIEQTEIDGQKCYCVKLWTQETRIKAREILDRIDIVYYILYIACTLLAICIYVKKLLKE